MSQTPKRSSSRKPAWLAGVAASACIGLVGVGCSSQKNVAAKNGEIVWNIEAQLRAAEAFADAGDEAQAKRVLSETRPLLTHPDLASNPDRHQLKESFAEIEQRLASGIRRAPVTTQAQLQAEDVEEEAPVVSVASQAEIAEAAAAAPDEIPFLMDEPSSKGAAAAFRSGPVKDHQRGHALIARAERTKKKAQRKEIYKAAESLLQSCVEQGSELLRQHPELKTKSFRSGSAKLAGERVANSCKKKLRWLMNRDSVAEKPRARRPRSS